MNTKLLVVRHAQTLSNITGRYMGWIDEDLSEEGVWQAEQLSQRLRHWSIAAVYSSPLKRAFRTAEIVALLHSLSVQRLDELGEIRLGAWEGMFAEEIAAKFSSLWRAWKTDPSAVQTPGGESLAQVQQRAVAALESITQINQDKQVLMVTHDVIVRLLVAYCLNVSPSIYRRLEVANASLTVIQVIDDKCKLRLLNDTGHLGS